MRRKAKGFRVVTPTWEGDQLRSLDRVWVERTERCELVSEMEVTAHANGAVLQVRATVFVDGKPVTAEEHYPTQKQLAEMARICGECGMKAGLPPMMGRRFDVGDTTTVFDL